ncbi:TPA: hypothetical protein PC496_000798 [Clostridioides difficile]|nr:hypothetical protein [Clostridioides difficile]
MKFTKPQKDILNKSYTEAFSSEDINQRVKEDYRDMYEAMAKDTLVDNGYPDNVDITKVNLRLNVVPKVSTEEFVDNLEQNGKIEDMQTFTAVAQDINYFIKDILDNIRMTNIEIEFKSSPEEYLEQYPTVNYLSKEISKSYDESKLREMVLEDEMFLRERVEPQAKDEGFENIDVSKLKFHIEDINIKESFTALADRFISNGKVGENDVDVRTFIKQDLYSEIIRERLYEAKVRFDMDPNDV